MKKAVWKVVTVGGLGYKDGDVASAVVPPGPGLTGNWKDLSHDRHSSKL